MLIRSIFINIVLYFYNIYLDFENCITSIFEIKHVRNTNYKYFTTKYYLIKIIKILNIYLNNLPFTNAIILYLKKIVELINSKYNLIEIEIFKNSQNKKIILGNKNILNMVDIIYDYNFDANNHIMNTKFIIIEINLIQKDKINIKPILDIYCDKLKKFDHKIKNIFKINNINYTMSDKLEIKYINLPKKGIKTYNLYDILDWHICDIYNLL